LTTPQKKLATCTKTFLEKITHSCYIVRNVTVEGMHYEDIAVWILDAMVIGAKVSALLA
jgi:hypothetical protein